MSYYVSSADLKKEYKRNEVNSILQNVARILATPKGSVPLYREFGLDMSLLDAPEPFAQTRMIAVLREAIERWEPRVQFKSVSWDTGQDGKLISRVEVEILGE